MNISLNDARQIANFDSLTGRGEKNTDKVNEKLLTELIFCLENPEIADPEWFKEFGTVELIDFLTASHQFYTNRSLPSIERHLEIWLGHPLCPESILRYGMPLFKEFQRRLLEHFLLEENRLFPMILEDGAAGSPSKYSLEHPHYSPDISTLSAFFSKGIKSANSPMAYRILMEKLRILERELKLHEFLEERVLATRIR